MTGLILALALTVTGIVDGDTFRADGVNHRLFGVNAPERDEPAGPAATRALERLILGERLTCTRRGTSFKRPVVQCQLPDGRDVSCEMARRGHAVDVPRYSKGIYEECEK